MESQRIARPPRAGRLLLAAVAVFVIAGLMVSCGGSSNTSMGTGMGMVNVTLSDPPSCMPPNGQFMHVYVTASSVQAHIDPNASDNSSGWRELAAQLASQPMQIDFLQAADDLRAGAARFRKPACRQLSADPITPGFQLPLMQVLRCPRITRAPATATTASCSMTPPFMNSNSAA